MSGGTEICKYTAMYSNPVNGNKVYYKCSDHRENVFGYRIPQNPCGIEGKYYVEKEKQLPLWAILWKLYENIRKKKTRGNNVE
jgi:hypothetical protein